jgi:beta-phosphoglucomutase family hydrolase
MEFPAALIFDCDGTLVDTMPAHYEAWVATLSRYGISFPEDQFYAWGGWPTRKVAEALLRQAGVPLDPEQLAREKEAAFERGAHLVRPIEPVVRVAREHRGRRPLAVATGGVRHVVEPVLARLGLLDWFETIVTSDDVTRYKPEPDVYLEAARRLGVPPAGCLVYEDTEPGLEAARRAGMSCIDVRTLYTPRRVTPRAVS